VKNLIDKTFKMPILIGMTLGQYAKKLGVTWRTAYSHFKGGLIPNAYQLPNGTIIVPDESSVPRPEYVVVYARVSSAENKSNLDSQADRVIQFCNANGWRVDEVVKECASGLNDTRPKLQKILKARKATKLVVEHKDRLTRFGFEYIKTLYTECDIIIINNIEDKVDLMQDFVSLVTSFCARLYGQRRTKRNTEKLIQSLNEDKT
jgi:predicted site-specific integrase-resolvase